jgi:hypothetical protein
METASANPGVPPKKRASRLRVIIPILAVGLMVLVGAFAWAARGYLSSRHAADQVAARLSEIYGGHLQLESVDIGTDRSELKGMRLFEEGGEDDEPWLAVDGARADVGAWALFSDNPAASNLDLQGATITLRIDEAGHLLTRIPRPTDRKRPLPNLQLHDGTLIFRQTGRPALTLHGIEAHMELDDGGYVVRGQVVDSNWGDWTATGTIDPETGAGEARFQTNQVNLTIDKLRALPFVASNVWEQVRAHGTTPVDFTFRFTPQAGSWKYRIVLRPESAWVYVRAIDLVADQVKGEVIIEDAVVTLKDLQGRTADGAIHTSADMDFRKRPKEMDFNVGVAGVDIRRLPRSWKIPIFVVGRLKGEAVLKVLVGGEPHVLTTGGGDGFINHALPVKLVYDGNRPHFTVASGPAVPAP